MQAKATLCFTGHWESLFLVLFYSNKFLHYQLDSRSHRQRKDAIREACQAQNSSIVKLIVNFLGKHASFEVLQDTIRDIILAVEDREKVMDLYDFRHLMEGPLPSKWETKTIGTSELTYDENAIDAVRDLPILRKLIGGLDVSNDQMAQKILHIIESRTIAMPLTLYERLMLIRIYREFVIDEAKALQWEESLKHPECLQTYDLEKLYHLSTYYRERNNRVQKEFWMNQLFSYLSNHPTWENF